MHTFDEYTKSIISSYLTEQVMPPGGKEGQVYVDQKDKRRYIFKGGDWRLWPKGEPIPYTQQRVKQTPKSPGMGAPAKPDEWLPIEDKGGTTGVQYASERQSRTGSDLTPAGYDPLSQVAWYQARRKLEDLMGVTGGVFEKGVKGAFETMAMPLDYVPGIGARGAAMLTRGAGNIIGTAADKFSPAVKQYLRTQVMKAMMGATDDIEFGDDMVSNLASAAWEQIKPQAIGSGGLNLFGKGRFGQTGIDLADQFAGLALLGMDPLELAMNAMGTKKTYDELNKTYSVPPSAVESAGGWLPQGKLKGIYK